MIEATFPQFCLAWAMLAAPILYSFSKKDWCHRYLIWAALWIVSTPVDPNLLRDMVWMAVCFMAVEWIFARVHQISLDHDKK